MCGLTANMRSLYADREQMYAYTFHQPLVRQRPRSPWPRRAWKAAIWFGLVLVAVFVLSRTAQGGGPQGYQTVTVGPGESLWTIASARYPGVDTRVKVDEILRVNGLHEASVYPGETLRVPAE